MSFFERGYNLPPGVSPNDPHITGEWPCSNCGATLPEQVECADCGGSGVTAPDSFGNRDSCPRCEDARERLREGECPGGCPEPDYDRINDERAERTLEDRYGY